MIKFDYTIAQHAISLNYINKQVVKNEKNKARYLNTLIKRVLLLLLLAVSNLYFILFLNCIAYFYKET